MTFTDTELSGDNATKRENDKNPYILIHRAEEKGEDLSDGAGKKTDVKDVAQIPVPVTVAKAREIVLAFEAAFPQGQSSNTSRARS